MLRVCIPTVHERRDRLYKCMERLEWWNNSCWFILTVHENNAGGWVKACHEMLQNIDDDEMVLILGDDALPQKGCISALYAEIDRSGEDKFYCVNDMHFRKSICVFPCAKAGYIKKYLYKGYNHYGADTELTLIAKAQNRFVWVPNSVVFHQNPFYGSDGIDKPEIDGVYERCMKTRLSDEALYRTRKKLSGDFHDLTAIELNK